MGHSSAAKPIIDSSFFLPHPTQPNPTQPNPTQSNPTQPISPHPLIIYIYQKKLKKKIMIMIFPAKKRPTRPKGRTSERRVCSGVGGCSVVGWGEGGEGGATQKVSYIAI